MKKDLENDISQRLNKRKAAQYQVRMDMNNDGIFGKLLKPASAKAYEKSINSQSTNYDYSNRNVSMTRIFMAYNAKAQHLQRDLDNPNRAQEFAELRRAFVILSNNQL